MVGKVMRYVPFAKVDAENRMVYGTATDETIDVTNDVVDYEATKAAVGDYQQWRNVREMHKDSAVGVAESIELDDEARALRIGARIVDDAAWEKVKTGVYKGFSIGGRARTHRMEKVNGQSVRRITEYVLTEISLVDRPANPSAVFALVKREEEEASTEEEKKKEEEGEATAEEAPEAKTDAAANEAATEQAATEPVGHSEEEKQQVRAMMIELLLELGLVVDSGAGQPDVALAARVENLAKQAEAATAGLAAVRERLEKVMNGQEDLQKREGEALGGLRSDVERNHESLMKVVGDVARVVDALEELNARVEEVRKAPLTTGPVLREIGFAGVNGVNGDAALLEKMMAETQDPNVRQLLGQRLAELQIKSVRQGQNLPQQ